MVSDASPSNTGGGEDPAIPVPVKQAETAVRAWGKGAQTRTFAQVLGSAPGNPTRLGQQVRRGSASGQTLPSEATTAPAMGPGFASLSSAGNQRRNVVILKWEGGAVSPARRAVVDLILGMGFGANDLYAFIHVAGTREYTISFARPEGLDLFWERYEAKCRSSPEWEGLAPIAVSIRSTIKKVTIILSNESVPARDLEVWLRHYGEVLTKPVKILDERNIWTGGWSVTIRLARDGHVVRHLPSSAFIGRDRMTVFYPGQPKLCHRCGEKGHFSSSCSTLVCTMCRAQGHVARDCTQIRCNLCLRLGHPYSQCPEAWHNVEKEVTEEFSRMDRYEAAYERFLASVAVPPGPVQDPSPAPVVPSSGSASLPSVSVPVPPTPSVSVPVPPTPSVSVPVPPTPSVSVPAPPQPSVSVSLTESVSPAASSPPGSAPSKILEGPPSLQGSDTGCLPGVVGGAKRGAAASSAKQASLKGKAKSKKKGSEVILSEDDLQYLEERRKVVRHRRGQVAQIEPVGPLPTSNRFSVLSEDDVSSSDISSGNCDNSDMELEVASRKRVASGDEQQRGPKKKSN